jgi:arylsulfatase A-like enzyme
LSNPLSRREFLKLSSFYLSSSLLPSIINIQNLESESDLPNIFIVVYDAFTATQMSLYGYDRETTPNISQLAEKAFVYHNHYAGGHWTYPGTASLLTGVHPWLHRGFTRGSKIATPYDQENLFTFFDDYYSAAYTHNYYADAVLRRIGFGIDYHHEITRLFLNESFILNVLLDKDYDIAAVSRRRIENKYEEGYASSLFFSHLTKFFDSYRERKLSDRFVSPPEVTGGKNLFLLEDATDWMIKQASQWPRPYLGYFHMFPPHDPYVIRNDFAPLFHNDGYKSIRKPKHFFTQIKLTKEKKLDELRLAYNQAIRYVDAEFGRLMENLEEQGELKNTWVIMTSDHGEMFERGLLEHIRPVFYDPIIKIPLLIFKPGQSNRVDIHTPTSAVDVIPTLLYLSGKPIPKHLEGKILPPFFNPPVDRSVFAMDAQYNPPTEKMSLYTAMHLKWPYKFTQYYGYAQLPDNEPYFELYDLENDPEEMENLYESKPTIAAELREELKQEIEIKDQPLKQTS